MKSNLSYHNNIKRRRRNAGFTMIELIAGVVILGILSVIGYSYFRDSAGAARNNAIATNVQELNKLVNGLDASGAVFATGTVGIVQGTSSTAARITLASTATQAAVDTLVNQLEGTGIQSMGFTAQLAAPITNTTYTYTLNSRNMPVFAKATNAIDP